VHKRVENESKPLTSQIAQTVIARGYLQVGEVGKDEIQIARRRWIQREKSPSGSPDVHRTAHLRKQQLSPSMRMSKAIASTVIAIYRIPKTRAVGGDGGPRWTL
jgi:hypothetical protein